MRKLSLAMAISEAILLSTPFKQPHDQRDLSLNLYHFRKFEVALNPLHGFFLNFAKLASYRAYHNSIIKNGGHRARF